MMLHFRREPPVVAAAARHAVPRWRNLPRPGNKRAHFRSIAAPEMDDWGQAPEFTIFWALL